MLYLYDIAIRDAIKSVYSNVHLAERTQLYKKIRNQMGQKGSTQGEDKNQGNGNIQLPLIGIWRIENTLDSDTSKFVEFNQGKRMGESFQDTSIMQMIKGINIPLTYQFDILASNLKDCDDLLVDTIVYLKENPIIQFNKHDIDFDFAVQLMDLSISTDFGSFSETGVIHSHTLTIQVPEARIIYSKDKKVFKEIENIES